MSIDGANLGLDAKKSLDVVLGGEEIDSKAMRTAEEMRKDIMASTDSYDESQKDYGTAALWLAKQYLILLDADYTGDLWDGVKAKFNNMPLDFSGFMVGWAENAARYAKGLPEKGNPAIMEIE